MVVRSREGERMREQREERKKMTPSNHHARTPPPRRPPHDASSTSELRSNFFFIFCQCHRGRFHAGDIRRSYRIRIAIEYGVQGGRHVLHVRTARCRVLHRDGVVVVVVVVGWKLHDDEFDMRLHDGLPSRIDEPIRISGGRVRRLRRWYDGGRHNRRDSRCHEFVHVSKHSINSSTHRVETMYHMAFVV